MKRLTKQQIDEKTRLIEHVSTAEAKLADAVEKYNRYLRNIWLTEIEPALNAVNEAIENLDGFRDDLHGQMIDYQGDKSEKWQESDAGQNYESWLEAYGTAIEQVEIPEPEPMECPEVEYSDFAEASDSPE